METINVRAENTDEEKVLRQFKACCKLKGKMYRDVLLSCINKLVNGICKDKL